MRSDRMLDIARRAGGTVTSAELIAGGARWEDLYRLRDEGALIELARGIYRVADAPATAHLDLVAVCRRAPDGMICLNSAASFWDLTDEMPDVVHVAIARGRHRPKITYPPTRVHVFATDTFALGRIRQELESAETIAVSSKERTVVDLLRLRSRVGRDMAFSALRRYLQSRDAKPGELLALARQLRVGTVMAEAMEPLLA
ncbi:MAG: type IV toxin-antitoxin system AbiEi family antitoxin domain-containing protein [Solirubrobacterales bacterium]